MRIKEKVELSFREKLIHVLQFNTRQEVADKIGCSKDSLQKWLTNTHKPRGRAVIENLNNLYREYENEKVAG